MTGNWCSGQRATLIENSASYASPAPSGRPQTATVMCYLLLIFCFVENVKIRFPGPTMVTTHPRFFGTTFILRILFLCAHRPLKCQYFSNQTLSQMALSQICSCANSLRLRVLFWGVGRVSLGYPTARPLLLPPPTSLLLPGLNPPSISTHPAGATAGNEKSF